MDEDDYFAAAETLKNKQPPRGRMNILAVSFFGGIGLCSWELYYEKKHELLWAVGLGICISGFGFVVRRYKGTKMCPRCRNDFTRCPPLFCHICGKKLEKGSCNSCAVDWNWIGCFCSSSDTAGNKSSIRFCPGCGAFINSEHHRHLPRGASRSI